MKLISTRWTRKETRERRVQYGAFQAAAGASLVLIFEGRRARFALYCTVQYCAVEKVGMRRCDSGSKRSLEAEGCNREKKLGGMGLDDWSGGRVAVWCSTECWQEIQEPQWDKMVDTQKKAAVGERAEVATARQCSLEESHTS